MPLSEQQQQLIERQLGRPPRGIVAVAHQTASGLPVVLQMRSLVDEQPFPTLYWLSSKDLYREISRIETAGWVKAMEAELARDADLRARYRRDHEAYVARRWALMDAGDRARIEALGFARLFDEYGIGGIRQWDKVRCLHMHYAHYLCDGNLIGERMEAEFGLSQLALTI
ncbi:DUF501 domain-containing protein [Motiliproteus sp. SC1-56]|uniref:DUF501 domain-containing protein n=1 Tax=Motiliproteus sp. SC1-56 TaxID=2799565 RepID=UPI001A8C29CF|nr:DUF501 domain-containing protein [Motiliproteus sp. SC1-56]